MKSNENTILDFISNFFHTKITHNYRLKHWTLVNYYQNYISEKSLSNLNRHIFYEPPRKVFTNIYTNTQKEE